MNYEKMNSRKLEDEYEDITRDNAWQMVFHRIYDISVEAEFQLITDSISWTTVYQKIGKECQTYHYTCIEAKKPQNRPLNRYRDVNPYDHTRIVLKRFDIDYINANLVKMERANRRYILTQGPLSITMGHFWLMVWEQDSRAIVMLNKVMEKNEIKCHWYWPRGVGEEHKIVMDDVQLAVELICEEDSGYYITRTLKMYDLESGATREVTQFHYTTWPDFGVPFSPVVFLQFLKRVRDSGALDESVGPLVIHCSAGIGRSGTFCFVDSCLVITEKEGVNSVNAQEILLKMRRYRMGLVQTPDQLRFSYLAIIEGTKQLDPNYKEPSELIETENDTEPYVEVPELSPPLPPRGDSLARPPIRPLPAIPTSASLGDIKVGAYHDSDSSDESPPTSPARNVASSADDEDEEPPSPAYESCGSGGESETVRKRRTRDRELSERVSAIKRKARDAERWHALKRSLYKPVTITLGVVIASILIYVYVKH